MMSKSEYLAPCDERIKFISGFSGSNGICVITASEALLWTDSRYYLQAEKQLEAGWKMMKWEAKAKTYFEWLSESSCKRIGIDPSQLGVAGFRNRSKYFAEKGLEMCPVTENLVDKVWGAEKPPVPQAKAFVLDIKYAGETVQEKYAKVSKKMEGKADALLVTTLDDIDWLLNIRGRDIAYNPVVIAYLIFLPGKEDNGHSALLFIDQTKLSDESVQEHLKLNRVEVHPYNAVTEHLKALAD